MEESKKLNMSSVMKKPIEEIKHENSKLELQR